MNGQIEEGWACEGSPSFCWESIFIKIENSKDIWNIDENVTLSCNYSSTFYEWTIEENVVNATTRTITFNPRDYFTPEEY